MQKSAQSKSTKANTPHKIIRSCPPNVSEEDKRTDRTGVVPLLTDRISQNRVVDKGDGACGFDSCCLLPQLLRRNEGAGVILRLWAEKSYIPVSTDWPKAVAAAGATTGKQPNCERRTAVRVSRSLHLV